MNHQQRLHRIGRCPHHQAQMTASHRHESAETLIVVSDHDLLLLHPGFLTSMDPDRSREAQTA